MKRISRIVMPLTLAVIGYKLGELFGMSGLIASCCLAAAVGMMQGKWERDEQ